MLWLWHWPSSYTSEFLQPRQLAGCRQKYSRKIMGSAPCNLFHAQAVLAAGRQHRTPVSFRHKIQLKNEVAKFREMFLNARQQNAALTQLRTRVAAATMHRTNHCTTTGNHWFITPNMANGLLVRCREGEKMLARGEKKSHSHFSSALRNQHSRQDLNLRGETPMDF